MDWNDKKLQKVIISSKKGGKTTLISGDKKETITLKKEQKLEINW